jgi:uncharacterized membrane protein YbhN (UPF0104 family)
MRIISWARAVAKPALLVIKVFVTALCFWYLSGWIDVSQLLHVLPVFDVRWAVVAVLVALLQIALLGLRWCEILDALSLRNERMTRATVIGITSIGAFVTQVMPNIAGEGMRVWLVARLGCDWRSGVLSVLIDRGVGVGLMVTLAFGILMVPSSLTALAGYRGLVLAVYGMSLLAGVLGLAVTPFIAPVLERWRYSRWLGTLAAASHRVLFGPRSVLILGIGCAVHAMTIVIIWLLGHAQGLNLPMFDSAVLFVVMVSIALIPVSVGGWGLRELAVVALLGNHGVAPEQALLFSVCFGLVFVIAALPGALVWLMYSLAK